MSTYYLNPEDESDPYCLPTLEVFYAADGEMPDHEDGEPREAGWYAWICLPGCLPDSDPFGPYDSEEEAVEDMRDMFADE